MLSQNKNHNIFVVNKVSDLTVNPKTYSAMVNEKRNESVYISTMKTINTKRKKKNESI